MPLHRAGSLLLVLAGLLSFVPVQQSLAQGAPDRVEIGVGATGATSGTVPFWLHTNTDGLVDRSSAGALVRGRVERSLDSEDRWDFGYGVELVGRASAQATAFFPALYAGGQFAFLKLRIGRKAETIGTVSESLTSGSLGQSRNATPIPKVVLSTTGYTGVPFTQQWLEFKGRYADGLLPDQRFAEGAYLHQKTFYLRGGAPSPVQAYAGLVHNAMWGGTAPDEGRLPQSLNDYARTVVALNGADDAPEGERVFIQGDHFGVIDVGLSVNAGTFEATAYRHFVYEDRDNLKFKSPQDGLFGLSLKDPESHWWVDQVVYEHLYTKWQNGPVPPGQTESGKPRRGGPGGRDDYYNHYIYESGWTLYGRVAGSPLFTAYGSSGGRGIANNRVVGHHLGVGGNVGSLSYRFYATYTRNYGTYDGRERALEDTGSYRFLPPLEQTSFALKVEAPVPNRPQVEVQAAIGADVGELYEDSVGGKLGVVYRPRR